MQHQGVKTAVLSLTAPGVCIVSDAEGQAALARQANDHAASLRDQDPQSFGFFATLPDVRNTADALKELKYAFDELHADGVTLFTRYERCYLGHADIEPIWKELDQRKATVFVHPTYPYDTHMVSPKMPLPLIDFPHETTRAAVDMMTSGTLQKYPNVKVILSHAGGSLPYLVNRMLTPLKKTEELGVAGFRAGVTYDQALSTFRSFYFDTALSSSPSVLRTLLEMVPHDHIVFGVSIILITTVLFARIRSNTSTERFPLCTTTCIFSFSGRS